MKNTYYICINNEDLTNLTLGNVYKCIEYIEFGIIGQLLIENDNGDLIYYKKSRFLTIEENRELRLNKILKNERKYKTNIKY